MIFLDSLTLRQARSLAVAWALFLFTLTSWPSPQIPQAVSWIPSFDKFVHSFLYGVQGFLVYLAIRWKDEGPIRFSWKRALLVGLVMMVWGSLDEIHQLWIPGRSCELGDAIADTVAGTLGAVAASFYSARRGLPTRGAATAAASPRS